MSATAVLDCSAAVHILRGTPEGKEFSFFIKQVDRIISSDLIFPETANTLNKFIRFGEDDPRRTYEHADILPSLIDDIYPSKEFYAEALRESVRFDCSSYDLFYFLLARRTGAVLITADRRLAALCEREGVECIHDFHWDLQQE